jgi:alkanesulfonate monooxygenase SsuD/methylene tetrahydromethanopterin reductase-like flavin-dependent oxidoreductase (luciferase family)
MARAGSCGDTVLLAFLSIGDERAEALRQVRPRLQRLVDFKIYPRLTEIAGMGADGSGEMTDAILQSIAVAGTPTDCLEVIHDWHRAGADCVVLVAGSDDYRANVERFAAEVLPELRSAGAPQAPLHEDHHARGLE